MPEKLGAGTEPVFLKITKKTEKWSKAISNKNEVVGRLFSIGETYSVDETLKLVKEDGRWKVCGNPFLIAGADYAVASAEPEEPEAVEQEAEEQEEDGEES